MSSHCVRPWALSPSPDSHINSCPSCQALRGRKWQPTAGFFLGKSHGQRSLGGIVHGGTKKLDTSEHTQQQRGP